MKPTILSSGAVFCLSLLRLLSAQTITTLSDFPGGVSGYYPSTRLIQGNDGNIYGAAEGGGANNWGTLFRLNRDNSLTVIYSFCAGPACPDGVFPTGLIQANSGDFYATTLDGQEGKTESGSIVQITPSGVMTTLYIFCQKYVNETCEDGAEPNQLVQGTDGDLYGTTRAGGVNGSGSVFKVTLAGTLTTLHSFCAPVTCEDGKAPFAGLIQATDGNFYGTTGYGGTLNTAGGGGTVFRISPTGTLTTLHRFCESTCADGLLPEAPLVQATDGDFYGTTSEGGGPRSAGTVFELSASGTLMTLTDFPDDGSPASPIGLIEASDGNLYGPSFYGGGNSSGALYRITTGGTLTSLYSFCLEAGCPDGNSPDSSLLQDTNGKFYGSTLFGGLGGGGNGGYGTIFSLSEGLPAFVKTHPQSGAVGEPIVILGNDLSGATGVTFDGVPAAFVVVSSSEITAKVPAGATSGKVAVISADRTLSSNVVFQVVQ